MKVKDAMLSDINMHEKPEPWDFGEDAYLSGLNLETSNPYSKDTRQHEEFILGYKMAERYDRNRLRGDEL
jgi:hypothetical protein